MPEIDGLELISEIRKHDSEMPIIAISDDLGRHIYLNACKIMGANATFTKPFHIRNVLDEAFMLLRVPH